MVDIGANVGVFALWVTTRNPLARVICVEPSPRTCEFLRRNISKNKLNNVTVVQAACGGKSGEADLYCRGVAAMDTLYCQDNYGSKFHLVAKIAVLTLQDLFEQFDVQVCNLLKLDCEGAEYEILFNASGDALDRVEAITMEYHVGLNEYTPDQLTRFLESRGFSVKQTPLLDEEGGYLYATKQN